MGIVKGFLAYCKASSTEAPKQPETTEPVTLDDMIGKTCYIKYLPKDNLFIEAILQDVDHRGSSETPMVQVRSDISAIFGNRSTDVIYGTLSLDDIIFEKPSGDTLVERYSEYSRHLVESASSRGPSSALRKGLFLLSVP